MDKMVLKLVLKNNPEIDVEVYRQALMPMTLDLSIVDGLFNEIEPSPKKHNSELLFTAAMLLLFSPRAILLSEKSEYGIMRIIKEKLGLKQHQYASYRVKVARELYEVDKVFRQLVNDCVERVRI
ncbi:hypothetical protein [Sphingobacterium suaedae]|uniref:Uncharacterized protein n=1 Tax=Sphingobacterium suaedae TaxID=1686402 RepID=A0ABW5KFC3_9SPHI